MPFFDCLRVANRSVEEVDDEGDEEENGISLDAEDALDSQMRASTPRGGLAARNDDARFVFLRHPLCNFEALRDRIGLSSCRTLSIVTVDLLLADAM